MWQAAVRRHGRAVTEEARRFDLHPHVGDPEAHRLERSDRLTELQPRAAVGEGA